MPSRLRLQSSLAEPILANALHTTSPTLPSKKQKMSLTQTYYVASTARSKLGREAGRGDHNLRRLVGHANLLDSLMIELADAEREQEAWFNQSVRKASQPDEPRHIKWIDTIAEEQEELEDDMDLDSDNDSEFDEDEEEALYSLPIRKLAAAPVSISSQEVDSDDESDYDMEDDDENDEVHALERVMSKHSPPELTLDSEDSESEDESMPSSPENSTFELSAKEANHALQQTTQFYDAHKSQGLEDYIVQQSHHPLIAAC